MPSLAARDLTRLSAAWALSFITSPSWPVRISLPLPGMRVASMNRMSPPTGVQARPVATPGTLVRIATSLSNLRRAEDRVQVARARCARARALPSAIRTATLRSTAADLALEIAHARLARVVARRSRAAPPR